MWRTLALLVRFYKRGDLVIGALALLGLSGYVALLSLAPLRWLVAGVIVLVLYAVALAVYTKFTEVEDRKEELEEKLEERQKRIALRDLLGKAVSRGNELLHEDPTTSEALAWGECTDDLVRDALTAAEAEFLFAGTSEDTVTPISDPTEAQQWIGYRMDRIMKLLQELHNYDINPNFNPDEYPEDWVGR